MVAPTFLIRQDNGAVIATLSSGSERTWLEAESTPAEIVLSISDWMEAQSISKASRAKLVFCPDPNLTLFAFSGLESSVRRKEHQEWKFLAETILPLDAERMAASFIRDRHEFRVLAVDHAAIMPWIEAFHDQEWCFRGIAPVSLLALESWAQANRVRTATIIWQENSWLDLWELQSNGPSRWNRCKAEAAHRDLAVRLFASQAAPESEWIVLNADDDTRTAVEALARCRCRFESTELQPSWAMRKAIQLCRGTDSSWFDLRDGVVAGDDRYRSLLGWLWCAAVSVLVMLSFFPLACWWKSQRILAEVAAVESLQNEIWQANFQVETLPPEASVSEAIYQKYVRATGSHATGKGDESSTSALEYLHRVLSSMSEHREVRLLNLNIDKSGATLAVVVPQAQVLLSLTESLRKVGFQVEPPSSSPSYEGGINANYSLQLANQRKAG